MLTGVGSSYIQQPLYGLPTARTDEFIANGLSAVCHGAGPAHGGEYGDGHFLCEGGT